MTWTLEASASLYSRNVTHRGYSVYDSANSKFYVIAGSGTRNEGAFSVVEITIGTWAQTTISSGMSWGSNAGYHGNGLALYDGDLYLMLEDQTSSYFCYVYKWDGTGTTTWTLVKTMTDYIGGGLTINPQLAADDDYLYAYASRSSGGIPSSANGGMHRWDGASWNGPDDDPTTTNFNPPGYVFGQEQGAGSGIGVYCDSDSYPALLAYDTGGVWAKEDTYSGSLSQWMGGNDAYLVFQKSADGKLVTSSDYGVTFNSDGPAGLVYQYAPIWNCGSGVLMACTGYDDDSYQCLTGSASVFSLHDSLPVSSGHVIRAFWRDGSTIYCIADNDSGTGGRIYSSTLSVLENRLLGIATDGQQVYVTGNQGGTLKMFTYQINPDLSTALVYINSVSAGAATYAQLDSRTYGIFPVCKLDGEIVYVRGRDGNDLQLQYSDDTGSTLTDISDAAWGSTKYAIACLIDPLNPADMIVPFSDDDIYHTEDSGETWTKITDADVTLREAARNLINEKQLLLAGQAAGAGELFWTPNYGESQEDVSDAGIDIINHIERSL